MRSPPSIKQGACHERDPVTDQYEFSFNSLDAVTVQGVMRNLNDALSNLQRYPRARAGAEMPSCFILR